MTVKLELQGQSGICSCGKERYETRGEAARQAAAMSRHRGTSYQPYQSDDCDCWHITSVTKRRSHKKHRA